MTSLRASLEVSGDTANNTGDTANNSLLKLTTDNADYQTALRRQ